jgi:hypothetical protein
MARGLNAVVRIMTAGAMLSGLTGCYDYPAVSTLSGSMAKTVGTWKPLADDYVENCKRAQLLVADHRPQNRDGTDPCPAFAVTQQQLNATFILLENYFSALGAVASDTNYSFDPGLGALGDAAKGIGADKSKTDAVTGLAGELAKLAASGIRQKSMASLIGQSDNVIQVVQTIKYVFDGDYAPNIGEEGRLWTSMMRNPASAFHIDPEPCAGNSIRWDTPHDQFPSPQELVFRSYYVNQCNVILARAAAITSFDKSADDLVDALKKLKSNATKLKDKEIAEAIFDQAKTVFDDAQAIQKAFNTTAIK